ncbi:MAG: phage tail assembly chaperone [Streptosporangiales bacterium]
MALRDSILAVDDLESVEEKVPEWDGVSVWIKPVSAAEWDEWRTSLTPVDQNGNTHPQMGNMRARLLVYCLYDEQGNKIFKRQDANALGQKSSAVLERLFNIATTGIGEDAKQAIEDAEGNSSAAPSGDSNSSSLAPSDAPSAS